MRKPTFIDRVMAERINYGGVCGTRKQVYLHALECCRSRLGPDEPNREQRARLGAEMFACGPRAKALTDEEASRLMPWGTLEGGQ